MGRYDLVQIAEIYNLRDLVRDRLIYVTSVRKTDKLRTSALCRAPRFRRSTR